MRRTLLLLPLLLLAACGDDDDAGSGATRTTESGTAIIEASDKGLDVEIQNDSLYIRLADDAPAETKALSGQPLGGACEVDGEGGVEVADRFPIYWREDPGDWGSALVRDPPDADGPENLADHVTTCRIFKTTPTGNPDESQFDEKTDDPYATVAFR